MPRPYDTALHRRLRRTIAPKIAAGGVTCWRCTNPIEPGEPWDLGHDDDDPTIYRGPEHARCNRIAGARKRDATPTPTRLGTRSRAW